MQIFIKKITNKFNKNIITDYCKKLNVMIDDANFWNIKKEDSLFQMHLSVTGLQNNA